MNLVDKVRIAGRKTALAFTLGSSLLLGGSGCQPVATVVAGVLVADAIRNNNPEVVYVSAQPVVQPTPQPQTSYIPRQNRFFAASAYKGDLNGSSGWEYEEYSGVGNEFEIDMPVFLGAEIYNRTGATLEVTSYKIEQDGKKLWKSQKLNVFGPYYTVKEAFDKGLSEGTYLRTYKIGDEVIGSTFIEVKSNLANK